MCLQVFLCLFQALLWHSLEQNLAILQQAQVFNSFTSSAYFRHSKHRWDFRIGGSGSSISSMFKDLMFLTAAAKLAGIALAIFAIRREDDRKIQTTRASTRFLLKFLYFCKLNWEVSDFYAESTIFWFEFRGPANSTKGAELAVRRRDIRAWA